ncbi:MAG TPA: FG-GAP-like repeat-containing protein [Actinocatenispora sp.]
MGASVEFTPSSARADDGVAEVATFQPEAPSDSAQDVVVMGGATGFVHHRQDADGPQWTDYVTGASHGLPWLAGVADTSVVPGGGDTIVVLGAGAFTVYRPNGDTVGTYQVPDGFTLRGVTANGTRALVIRPAGNSLPAEVRLLDLAAGGAEVPITGVPDGATVLPFLVAVDGGTHAAVGFRRSGAPPWVALIDMTSGAATQVPQVPAGAQKLFLTGTDLGWAMASGTDYLVGATAEAAALDGTAGTPPPAITLPTTSYVLAAVGGHLLVGKPSSYGSTPTVVDYPFAGGAPTTALAYAPGMPVVAADGTVIVVGGADPSSAAVHRYAADADGAVTGRTVLDLPPVTPTNAGVTLAHGYLRHVEGIAQLDGSTRFRVYNHGIAPDDAPGFPFTHPSGVTLPAAAVVCQEGQQCVRTVDGNSYGTSYLVPDGAGTRVQTLGQSTGYTVPTTGGRLVDVSLGYQIVAGGSAATMYVVRSGAQEVVASGPDTGAALWDDTLWQAPTTAAAGTITATNLTARPPKVVRTISVGSTCRPSELQVAQHWLYWSCGTSGPAGVYDLTTGHTIPVTAGRALLGDGYLVRHDDGQLLLTDVHDGTAATPRVIATLPATAVTDDRAITWTVDRFGGDLAYVDADNVTHVLTTGVPASPLTAHTDTNLTAIYPRLPDSSYQNTWSAYVVLDRPVDSWRLTISRKDSGAVAYTTTGGASRELFPAAWDGRLATGALATSGAYRWQFTATVDGATVPVGGASGLISVRCGTRPFRSYDCSGSGALLTVRSDSVHYGQAAWWQGTDTGTLASNGYTEDWHLGSKSTDVSALVPFGDINNDGQGDLLARTGDGVLYAHLGIGQADFGGTSTVRLGGGYNAYNTLLSVGDVDHDGHDDLLERDTTGTMWFKGGTGNTALKARVQIATGWNTYTRLAAIGDINGDGRGDLIAVDHNNIVWRYYGAAGGTFPHRTQIATGWNTYNRIIGVGDLTGDGRPDLITRDSTGTIWRYDATTTATYPHRVKIATGWNTYNIY